MQLHTAAQNSAGERVRIALNLKGIPYDYVDASHRNKARYRLRNPQGLLPTLTLGPDHITQSLAIIEYLEEVTPPPTLFPAEPLDRAKARAFALTIAAETHAITVKRVRRKLAEMGLSEGSVADWNAHWSHESFTALERTLQARDTQHAYCFAPYPTIADIALVPQLANARRFGLDLSEYGLLTAIEARCNALDAFQNAKPQAQPDYRP